MCVCNVTHAPVNTLLLELNPIALFSSTTSQKAEANGAMSVPRVNKRKLVTDEAYLSDLDRRTKDAITTLSNKVRSMGRVFEVDDKIKYAEKRRIYTKLTRLYKIRAKNLFELYKPLSIQDACSGTIR